MVVSALAVANLVGTDPSTAACGLVLVACALTSQRHPLASACTAWGVLAASVTVLWIGPALPAYLIILVPLAEVALRCRWQTTVWSGVAVAVGGILAGLRVAYGSFFVWITFFGASSERSIDDALSVGAALAVAVVVWLSGGVAIAIGLLGKWRATRATDQAERRVDVARQEATQAELAAAAERARISREMHDIVAHSLSVIIAQADGGRYAGATDPEAATRALTAIAETGRAALTDMRGILGILKENPAERDDLELRPAPHVKDLDQLVESVRAAGLNATLVRVGTPHELPPGVGLALHRIAQEALTNVMKHAGPDVEVAVLEQWGDGAITLTVSDDGRGAAASTDGAGQGMISMRERAEMLGGVFAGGPGPTGGFQVRVTVPLPSRTL
jgi:signal transduction histidine kinase